MDHRLGRAQTRAARRVGLAQLLGLVALITVSSAAAVHAQPTPTCTDFYTGGNGDASNINNWQSGHLPGASSDVCIMPAGTGTVAFIGPWTFHSIQIGDGVSSFYTVFAYGSSSTKTTRLTITDTMTIAPGAGFAFGALDMSGPTVTLSVGGNMRDNGTIFANGGFSFKPVIPILDLTDGQIIKTFNVNTATRVKGALKLTAGSTVNGHSVIQAVGCTVTPTPLILTTHSAAAALQCPDEGTLSIDPGAYQVGVDIGGVLDLSESSGTRTLDSYTQDSSGTTKLALTSGSSISEVAAIGGAVLGGTLEVDEFGDTPPQNGDLFPVITAASVAGTFSALAVLNACFGQNYSLVYSPTNVKLAVDGVCATPTPSPTLPAAPTATPTALTTAAATETPSVAPPGTTGMSTSTRTPEVPATQTAAHTPTATPHAVATATPTPTDTPTNTATATRTATATVVTVSCVGDCNNSGDVTIDELVKLVNIALGGTPPSACPGGLTKTPVTIDEIISGVNNALGGCPPKPPK
jgi:hypothetical protein